MIRIITDSTCDLSKELIEKYNIRVIPLHVSFPGDDTEYLDGVNINSEQLYDLATKLNVLPKTGAVNVVEFIKVFEEELAKGNEIFYVGIGSGLSSSYNNACIAREQFPDSKIVVLDGQNLSTGTGLIVIKAARLAKEGKSLEEIKEICEKAVPLVSAKFCIDRLDYLYKGGRCSGMAMIAAHALKIHPVAKVINNKLVVYKKPRGKYENAVEVQIDEFMYDLDNIDKSCVFITHSGRMDGIEKQIYDKISPYLDKENLFITEAGCTISSHCGPKTIGILYILKK
ncbi:MAG: DegV family protein [Candidatus Onthovivens sp.]|nr:DegV family protein [Mollicutes bacterium]MDY4936903.1 DegV family protein [Candidatus Onthovivens sp.]